MLHLFSSDYARRRQKGIEIFQEACRCWEIKLPAELLGQRFVAIDLRRVLVVFIVVKDMLGTP